MRTIIAAAGVIGLSLAGAAGAAAQDVPTYNEHVGPILLDNCASCHRPNQVAPMSLMSYRDARPWARAIKAKVEAREMPPWFADPRFGEFSNDTSLSDEQIETIVAWADGGAPEGAGPAPEAPRFSAAGWSHPSGQEPDYVIEFPIAWQVDAEGETPNFNLYTPLPFDDVMTVSATQVRPGNYAATHHITTGLVNMPTGMVLGRGPAWAGGPEVDYVPVRDASVDPEEMARLTADGRAQRRELTAEQRDEAAAQRAGFGPYIPGVGADVARPGQVREIRGDPLRLHHLEPALSGHRQAGDGAALDRGLAGHRGAVAAGPQPQPERNHLRERSADRAAAVDAGGTARQGGLPAGGAGAEPAARADSPQRRELDGHRHRGFQNDAVIQSMFVHAHVRARTSPGC